MEIGSVYEMDPGQVKRAGWEKRVALHLEGVEKYGKQNTAYTASGREAISLALQSLEREQPHICKKCLMPAYMCDSVFLPFVQNGWELLFYHIGKDMKADADALYSMIEREKPGMIFIHTYYGVDTWSELRSELTCYQREGLILMEDVTQSYYLDADFTADYVVGSLRKWYAVTDGGFVTTNHSLCREIMEYEDSFAKNRAKMQIQKWHYLQECQGRPAFDAREKQQWVETVLPDLIKEKEEYLLRNRELEEDLDENRKIREVSMLAVNILNDTDEKKCKERRNLNYRILQKGLQNRKSLLPVFLNCEKSAAPLYLPVYMKNRDALQQYLREQDIYVPVLWPVGKENAGCLSEEEQYIFSHIAAIPMDQRYGKEEMERIVAVIEEYEAAL